MIADRRDELEGPQRADEQLARLRAHISSMNDSDTPRLERNSTSQSRTAEMSTPAACATHELCWRKNAVTKPHRIICTVGQ